MQALLDWVGSLTCPGVLVVGQPVLAKAEGRAPWGEHSDWNLPAFDQYPGLVRALSSAPHDILVLSGDVHFGRIATFGFRRVMGAQREISTRSSPPRSRCSA